MSVLILVILLIAAFFLRAFPRIVLPYGIASDSYFHLNLVKILINHKLRYPKRDERFLLNPLCTYPYLHHLLSAVFGSKGIYLTERFSSAFYDTCNTLIVYVMTSMLCEDLVLPWYCASIATGFYALHPILFKFGDEPRVYNGTSRVLAQTIYFAHCLGLYYYHSGFEIAGIILTLITGALLFNITKFGIQVILFFGIFFSILFPLYLPIVFTSFFLSVILSRGRTWGVLYIHIQHLIFLVKTNLYYRKFSPLTDLKKYLAFVKMELKFIFQFKLREFFNEFFQNQDPIHNLVIGYHSLLVIFTWPWFKEAPFFYIWMLAGICFFLLTKTPYLRFIGKAERYLEFALIPSFIICACWLVKLDLMILLIPYALFCLTGILVNGLGYIKRYRSEHQEFNEINRAFEKFNLEQKPGVIWTLNQHFHKPVFFTHFPILGYFAGTVNQHKSPKKEIDDMMKHYPYPDYDLFRILREYQVKYIITLKANFEKYLHSAQINQVDIEENLEKIGETQTLIFIRNKKI